MTQIATLNENEQGNNGSDQDDDNKEEKEDHLYGGRFTGDKGWDIGATVGIVLVLALIIGMVCKLCQKHKKQVNSSGEIMPQDNQEQQGGNQFSNNQQQTQQINQDISQQLNNSHMSNDNIGQDLQSKEINQPQYLEQDTEYPNQQKSTTCQQLQEQRSQVKNPGGGIILRDPSN